MEARFNNGVSVTRVWAGESTEMLAVFQYDNDAVTFAEGCAARDLARGWSGSHYIVADGGSGKIKVVPPKKPVLQPLEA